MATENRFELAKQSRALLTLRYQQRHPPARANAYPAELKSQKTEALPFTQIYPSRLILIHFHL